MDFLEVKLISGWRQIQTVHKYTACLLFKDPLFDIGSMIDIHVTQAQRICRLMCL
jgi:hypothetical protein